MTKPRNTDVPALRQLSSRIAYESPFMRVREDEIECLDGSRGIYSLIDKPDFALVIPEEDGGFWLVEQYRYPLGARSWEFPQGTFPPQRTGTPEELAREELAQETGLQAGKLEQLGYLHCAKSFTGQGFHVFHATELEHGEPQLELEEQDLCHQWFSRAELESMIRAGTITDDSTLAAYLLLVLRERG